MKFIAKKIVLFFSTIRLLPCIIIFVLKNDSDMIYFDFLRWVNIKFKGKNNSNFKQIFMFVELMTLYPEYRSQFYYRIGLKGKFLLILYKPMQHLYIHTESIGPGLFIQHGFSTIISAKKIGKNCWINQQVTIGFSNNSGTPFIGDNVTIRAGSKIFGGINVGNNVIIGANAVVTKNVPANCTVVGAPAYIIKKNGTRVKEKLR